MRRSGAGSLARGERGRCAGPGGAGAALLRGAAPERGWPWAREQPGLPRRAGCVLAAPGVPAAGEGALRGGAERGGTGRGGAGRCKEGAGALQCQEGADAVRWGAVLCGQQPRFKEGAGAVRGGAVRCRQPRFPGSRLPLQSAGVGRVITAGEE